MKNSSLITVSPAASIEVGSPGPRLVWEKNVRGQEVEAFENQGMEGTYYRPEQTMVPSNIRGSH